MKRKRCIRKYKEMRSKIKYLIKAENHNSVEYDNKYLKHKINCDEDFALVKSLAMYDVVILTTINVEIFHRKKKKRNGKSNRCIKLSEEEKGKNRRSKLKKN